MKSTPMDHIDIVMPVYNGSIWLDQMLASIFAQDHEHWSLTIWNDGSTDDTEGVLQKWKPAFGSRLNILDNPGNVNLGINRSFSLLLESTSARYVMRADCDDIWYPEKMRVSLEAIKARESTAGESCPIVIHTNMDMIGPNNEVLSESAWQYLNIAPYRNYPLNRLLFKNVVSGAASIMNRSLVNLVYPVPDVANSDDWWLALVASTLGQIEPLNVKTMGYRQHDKNDTLRFDQSHVSKSRKELIFDRIRAIGRALKTPAVMRRRVYELLTEREPTLRALYERYGDSLKPADFSTLEAYLTLKDMSFLDRKIAIVKYKLWFPYPLVNIGYFLLV